jgi:hypothetical protein
MNQDRNLRTCKTTCIEAKSTEIPKLKQISDKFKKLSTVIPLHYFLTNMLFYAVSVH